MKIMLPTRPGQSERRACDCLCHAADGLFAASHARTSNVISQLRRRHRSMESGTFPDTIEADVPTEFEVYQVMDKN